MVKDHVVKTLLLTIGATRAFVGFASWITPSYITGDVLKMSKVRTAGHQGDVMTRLFGSRDFLLGMAMMYYVVSPATQMNKAILNSFIKLGIVMDVMDVVAATIAFNKKALNLLGFTMVGIGAAMFAGFGAYSLRD